MFFFLEIRILPSERAICKISLSCEFKELQFVSEVEMVNRTKRPKFWFVWPKNEYYLQK